MDCSTGPHKVSLHHRPQPCMAPIRCDAAALLTRSRASVVCTDRFVKRTPLRPPTLQHDIYITTSRQRTALLRRAHRLLIDERLPFIILHGLGAAIPVAVELALQLTGAMPANGGPARLTDELVRAANAADDLSDPTSAAVSSQLSASSLPAAVQSLSPFASSLFTVSIRTGTEVLIDDYVPLLPGLPPVAQQRHNSSIHITIAIKPDAAAAILASNDNRPTHTRTAAAATATTAAGGGSRASRGGGGGGDRGRGRGRGGGKHGHGNPQSFQPAKRQKQ